MATENYKIFNDSVHGHIRLHPLLVKIIDTPEFQRLRKIKQLGGGYFVFPGASHNRFEHSIGVAHLAGELVRSLRAHESEITDQDELCVQIAGLCHDLGHGPYSHVFEIFMKEEKPDLNWTHEKASIEMFEQLMNNRMNGIREIMAKYRLDDQDIMFIKELIFGPNPPNGEKEKWPYRGRPMDKSYLYEIVANKSTGIDVDKMDYFSRDCLHLGMKSNFSHERYMKFARVCTTEKNEKKICMRDKEALNMYELFHIRYLLHKNAYQHRVKKAIELMIIDALLAAEKENFKLDGKTISETVSDMSTYLKLTDNILDDIKRETENAKEIIEKIERRDLYRFIDGKLYKGKPEWLRTERVKTKLSKFTQSSEEDFRVTVINFDYGQKEKNPIDSLWFYRRDNTGTAIKLEKDEVSYIKPEVFQETNVFLFYTKSTAHGLNDEQLKNFWNSIEIKNYRRKTI
ncbi:deoxynucleoside triphosphate triphosphohydrolase SAMHD1-like isoform X2 [Tachysurus fulvidraco]|uniref:deoxynucleoside triphosphate triphosphohydrolase SAMHD1-like isoform X2 n=1 Tax=Tachysurus fulvidraco TaxID=1234273 RepID=UPI001FEED557|nr:deoxynucleoside triphosphate triphosphohydrolase SAMHD1-like isoform X2 [Tachysurus fulvidraco]